MSRPRIDLLAPPFAGHLHPILAMGRALSAIADVEVIATEAAQQRIRAAGLKGTAVVPGADATLRAIVDPPYPVGSNPLRLHAQLRRALELQAAFASVLDARYRQARPDLLIADFALFAAGPVAQRHGIPWWTSHPSPCVIEARGGPPAYLGGWQPGQSAVGRLRDTVGGSLVRGFKRGLHRLHARPLAALGFPSPYRDDGSEAAYSPECILALGLRELEFERDWPASVRFVGPLLWSPEQGAPPPDDPGTTPVLVTLGTHLGWAKDRLAKRLDGIAARRDWTVHFSDGRFDGADAPCAGRLRRHAWIDYARWIPRMRAVLHHGGAGAMWECLRAGVPALVLPVDYDQFDHAARLHAAGAALRLRHPREIESAFERVLDGAAGLQPDRFADALRPGLAEARVVAMVRARLGI